jgi:phosphatidylinositol 4-kinase
MVDVMGGVDSQGYRLFTELTVKAFLACRPYVDEVCETARLMIGTDLPSFKGEPTIQRLRDRFQPDLTERQAAKYMQGVIANAQFSRCAARGSLLLRLLTRPLLSVARSCTTSSVRLAL